MATLSLVQLVCPGCAGALQYTAGSPVAACPFCGSTIALVTQGRAVSLDGLEYRAIPFRRTAEQFKSDFLQFLAAGDYTPEDVFEAVQVRKETGLFAAVYLMRGKARVSWAASAGFQRQESYVGSETVNQGGRTVQRPVTRTRTVTDWRPVTGDLIHDYRLGVLASAGVPDVVAPLVEDEEGLPPDDALALVDPSQVKGYALEPFEGSPEERWKQRGGPRLEAQIKEAVERRIPGDEKKQVTFTHSRESVETIRLYRPLWLAVYTYGDKKFAFAQDGATGRQLGTRPEDVELRKSVEKLRNGIKNANMLALVAGVVSFFLMPVVGLVVVGVVWYLYTDAEKKKLSVLEKKMAASAIRRGEMLQATQRSVPPPLPDGSA